MAKKFCQNSLFNDNIQKWKVNERKKTDFIRGDSVSFLSTYTHEHEKDTPLPPSLSPYTKKSLESPQFSVELRDAFVRDNK